MKILVLNGSPKADKSNTMQLTHAFLEGTGWKNPEIIHVANMNIQNCKGCFACWNKTPGQCVLRDDMKEILDKLIAADVILWSFPLYYFSVPGILKNLIDRKLPLFLPFMERNTESGGHPSRYDLSHQRHFLLSTCGFWTPKGNYDSVLTMFHHFLGETPFETLFCGQGELFQYKELQNQTLPYLEMVKKAGREYAQGKIQEETWRALEKPLLPRPIYEDMADASWGVSQENASLTENNEAYTLLSQMALLYQPDEKNRILEFHFTDLQETLQILLSPKGAKVTDAPLEPYTTRIETPFTLWQSISRGEISGQDAFFQGKYKVLGDMSLMMNWNKLFSLETHVQDTAGKEEILDKKSKPYNMLLLLFPWIVFWVALPFSSRMGSGLSILLASLTPLMWMQFQATTYERVSLFLLSSLSLMVLFNVKLQWVLPGSYLLFGLLWLSGSRAAIPLTAYYSSSSEDGLRVFSNPIFIDTNRILTTLWACLFLGLAVLNVWVFGKSFAHFSGLMSGVFLGLMGAFTSWFAAWYPPRAAKTRKKSNA